MKNIAKNFSKLTNIQQQFKLSKSLVNTQTQNFLVCNKNCNFQGNFNAEIYCLNNICKQNFAKKGKKQEEKQNKKEEKKNLSEQLDKKIDLNVPEQNFKLEIENLSKQLKKIQVGRLTPDFFDRYEIPAYGGKQRFNELAQITPKNETTVVLNVYDEGLVNAVYKTLENSGEQFQLKIEGKNIQVVLLGGNTKEAKQNSVKEAEKITLKCKNKLKDLRASSLKSLAPYKKVSSKDTVKMAEDEIQTMYQEFIKQADKTLKDKERELLNS